MNTTQATKPVPYFAWQYLEDKPHVKVYRGVVYGYDPYDAAGEVLRLNGPGKYQLRSREGRVVLKNHFVG